MKTWYLVLCTRYHLRAVKYSHHFPGTLSNPKAFLYFCNLKKSKQKYVKQNLYND